MSRTILRAFAALALLSLLAIPLAVSAHETITAGKYSIEYGWLNEPPVVGQPNAVVINIGSAEGTQSAMPSGTLSLAAPADGAKVQGDTVPVSVNVEGVDENAEGVHWHLYLDDHLLSMVPVEQSTVTVTGLSNGMHTLKASLAQSDHSDMGEPATAMVTVEGSSAAGDASVPDAMPMAAMSTPSQDTGIEVDVSNLKIEVVYGSETKTLSLQPLGEDTPGQFVAPLTPTRAGTYTVRLSGKLSSQDLGDTDVSAEVEPEEVQTADVVQFPGIAVESPKPADTFGLAGWLGVAGVLLGGVGVALGAMALTRKK